MFERFTEQARQAVALARDEARALGYDAAGTGHLLLGLLGEGDSAAARVLASLGADLPAIREQLTHAAPASPASAEGGEVTWTPAARNVLELALREALRLGHNHIGTEHLLLSLVHEPGCEGAQALTRLGVDCRTVRRTVITLLHEPGATPGG